MLWRYRSEVMTKITPVWNNSRWQHSNRISNFINFNKYVISREALSMKKLFVWTEESNNTLTGNRLVEYHVFIDNRCYRVILEYSLTSILISNGKSDSFWGSTKSSYVLCVWCVQYTYWEVLLLAKCICNVTIKARGKFYM